MSTHPAKYPKGEITDLRSSEWLWRVTQERHLFFVLDDAFSWALPAWVYVLDPISYLVENLTIIQVESHPFQYLFLRRDLP